MNTHSRLESDYRVYVMLGFHANFYHSWRGDTPDEAGFGTDIRVIRQVLQILDRANAQGQQAVGYWDFEVYWTLERIIPEHAPDIIESIRRRVAGGLDEIVLDYYNNGANHAATEQELRTAVKYAFENPYGSGLRQIFGETTNLLRPQESMYTGGQNAILLDEGISGLVLYYSGTPFNALSNFLPVLPPELRYGLFTIKSSEDDPPIEVWPCISTGDLVEHVSLEALLIKLRNLQITGQVQSDLLVHLNVDADSDTWLPVGVPGAFAWFPNTGGLEEYIRVVNRYPWAAFTVPSQYRRDHEPQGEFILRQDLADGGFDGSYSWAEKYSSLVNWTLLEASRLNTCRAQVHLKGLSHEDANRIQGRLWEGRDSVFFRRMVGMTTTHFGMSTPVINAQRQDAARQLLGSACQDSLAALREAAALSRKDSPQKEDHLYSFEVHRTPAEFSPSGPQRAILRIPVALPPGVGGVRLVDQEGTALPVSLVNAFQDSDGWTWGELLTWYQFEQHDPVILHLYPLQEPPRHGQLLDRLENRAIKLVFSTNYGIEHFSFMGKEIGGRDYLSPFISYRVGGKVRHWSPGSFQFTGLENEVWGGLSRVRMKTEIAINTGAGPVASQIEYTFTLFDDLPYIMLDVEVNYADTPPGDLIQNIQQRLRRRLDLNWIEVAPCQVNPIFHALPGRSFRVWKHNYLGVTASYDINYGEINPRNQELDSFNHQVTAGWVAVSNHEQGLLLAENAEYLSSMAFCPMRTRVRNGRQHISLNPFGSYYGRQFNYRHLGGTGVGAEVTAAASGFLHPNAPSFNGQRIAFSLLLAPYQGDCPSFEIQRDAGGFFYPPMVLYTRQPLDSEVSLVEDMRSLMRRRTTNREGLFDFASPGGFLASPSDGAVDLSWDFPSDERIDSLQLRWRMEGVTQWELVDLPLRDYWRIEGLENGVPVKISLRARAGDRFSEWTPAEIVTPGAVQRGRLTDFVPGVPPGTMLRLVYHSLVSLVQIAIFRFRHRSPGG